jgi:hypothetical protein
MTDEDLAEFRRLREQERLPMKTLVARLGLPRRQVLALAEKHGIAKPLSAHPRAAATRRRRQRRREAAE